jgi:hypothetical protein
MDHDPFAVCKSPGAQQIQAYCRDLGQQLQVPVQSTSLMVDNIDDSRPVRYLLSIEVKGLVHIRQPAFTQDQVLGYPDGSEAKIVEARIREELMQCLDDLKP